MTSSWYCNDCETRIDSESIDDHETQGHHVTGVVRPNRLLGNDPWNIHVEVDGELDGARSIQDGGEH